jgi:hypothetical protein
VSRQVLPLCTSPDGQAAAVGVLGCVGARRLPGGPLTPEP